MIFGAAALMKKLEIGSEIDYFQNEMNIKNSIILILLLSAAANGFSKGMLVLTWCLNPEQDLSGYRIYYGLKPGRYTDAQDVGLKTAYTLSDLQGGQTYYFAVAAYDRTGNESQLSSEVVVQIPLDLNHLERVRLFQNYPNPFNDATVVWIYTPGEKKVVLRVLDALGREVASLYEGIPERGIQTIYWNGKNRDTNPVSSGVYFLSLEVDEFRNLKKIVMMK
jgi:hypothetical protein